MSRRLLDYMPPHAASGTVHYTNPDDPHDRISIVPLKDGGLEIRAESFNGPLVIQPRVSNEIWVTVARRS